MAAMDFPNSPSDGQLFTPTNGATYQWSAAGSRWVLKPIGQQFLPLTGGTLSGDLNISTSAGGGVGLRATGVSTLATVDESSDGSWLSITQTSPPAVTWSGIGLYPITNAATDKASIELFSGLKPNNDQRWMVWVNSANTQAAAIGMNSTGNGLNLYGFYDFQHGVNVAGRYDNTFSMRGALRLWQDDYGALRYGTWVPSDTYNGYTVGDKVIQEVNCNGSVGLYDFALPVGGSAQVFETYEIELARLRPSANGYIYIQLGTAGGIQGVDSYYFANSSVDQTGIWQAANTPNAGALYLCPPPFKLTSIHQGLSGFIRTTGNNNIPHFTWNLVGFLDNGTTGGRQHCITGGGCWYNGAAITTIRVGTDTGMLAAGTIRFRGRR